MDVSVPTYYYIKWDVRRLRSNSLLGPFAMIADHHQQWMRYEWWVVLSESTVICKNCFVKVVLSKL